MSSGRKTRKEHSPKVILGSFLTDVKEVSVLGRYSSPCPNIVEKVEAND